MSDQKLNLPPVLEELRERLMRLNEAQRDWRWRRFRRVDPFVEATFDRKDKGRFLFDNDVTIHDSVVINGDIMIGEGTHVGQFCNLDGSGTLRIGRSCSISAGVRIMTHDTARRAVSGGLADAERSPVTIGDCCFIGANAVVTRGVTIGDRCVVGAGAVVVEDVPPATIVVGVPARPIGDVVVDGNDVDFRIHSRR